MFLKILWATAAITVFLGTLQSSSAAFLRCYNGKIDDYVEEPLENAEALLNSSCYDSTLFNLFYIFGFNGKVKGNLTEEVLNALLNLQDRNTFLVNWEKEAESVTNLNNAGYISSYVASGLPNSVKVGFQLGAALARMSDLGFDLSKTHAMGHSLGAHVLGNAGRYLIKAGKIISRISGCDPAGALFDKYAPIAPALDKSCADFVDITHTDPGGYATNSSKAHLDIWFNYGNFIYGPEEEQVQPGCPVGDYEMFTSNDLCSHNRCLELWIQTWSGTTIEASQAEDYYTSIKNAEQGITTNVVVLGDDTDRAASGNYYMNTTGSPPYQPTAN